MINQDKVFRTPNNLYFAVKLIYLQILQINIMINTRLIVCKY